MAHKHQSPALGKEQEGDIKRPRRGPGRPRHTEPSQHFIERRQAILDAAREAFRAHGYSEGSLEDIAEAIGIQKASLYYYFQSKSHLLYHLFDQQIQKSLDTVKSIVGDTSDPADRLKALIRHQVMLVTEDPGLFRIFFDNRPTLDDEISHIVVRKERTYVGLFASAVADAVDAGVLPNINALTGGNTIIGMIFWLYRWYQPEFQTPEQITEDLTRMILGA